MSNIKCRLLVAVVWQANLQGKEMVEVAHHEGGLFTLLLIHLGVGELRIEIN